MTEYYINQTYIVTIKCIETNTAKEVVIKMYTKFALEGMKLGSG